MQAQPVDTKHPRQVHGYTDKIPVNEALRLRLINRLSFSEIARIYGVAPQSVNEKLSRYINRLDVDKQAQAYSQSEANFLKYVESELALDLLSPEKRAAASLNNSAYAFGQVNKARLLAEGRSTENIDHRSVVVKANAELDAIRAEIARRTETEQQCSNAAPAPQTGDPLAIE